MAAKVRAGESEAMALLEHWPVFTFGRRVRAEHLLVEPAKLCRRGATVFETDRGGDVTFHGPGQLVVYPILDLRRRRIGPCDYVQKLEATIIQTLRRFDVAADRWPGRPGVWFGRTKIAAIGVRVHDGISTHGLALNVATDLSWFDAIIPCGLSDAGVTSMAKVLDYDPGVRAVCGTFCEAFADVFDSELVPQTPLTWDPVVSVHAG
jgi:lipoate-protein ligase B